MSLARLGRCALTLVVALTGSAHASPPDTRPVEGLRDNTPAVHALTNARIVVAPGRVIDEGTVVIRDGMIDAVVDGMAVPADARVWNLGGKTIYPGLLDAYDEVSLNADLVASGAPHWNDMIVPQLSVADHYKADRKLNETLRGQGVTARLVAPSRGIWKGASAVVLTGDEGNRSSIVRGDVAQHVRLTLSRGRGRDNYPNSPMGAVALARQTLYDANWYDRAWSAYRADKSLPRPERNDALATLSTCRSGKQLAIVDAANELFVLRANRYAREFGLRIAIRGSGYEYRRLDAIKRTGRAVILPLNFPKPPNVGSAETALNVRLDRLMHWDIAPENPARLEQAGIPIALTSHGLKDQAKFLKAVRKAVERGLSPDAALRALTTTPASLFGVSDQLGTVESGKIANLVVTDGDLFAEKTKVHETWVNGRRYEIETSPLFDLRGMWHVELADDSSFAVRLEGKPDKLKGKIDTDGDKQPADRDDDDDEEQDDDIELDRLGLRDARFSCTFKSDKLGHKGVARLTAVVEFPEEGQPTWTGQVVWPDGKRVELVAERTTKAVEQDADDDDDEEDDENDESHDPAASFAVNYPLGAFGVAASPTRSNSVVFRNATVWTAGKAGTLKKASVHIAGGKVVAVGRNIEIPTDAVVIDAKGKHITPGIIDCHSHMGTDGGVNESAQAITAEVRIGDFIDADDIAIYRQLAGGVTTSNILHGSANPIGGQNQVIKLRWGALPEELKFRAAPAGIKFALGENVKQSNWGDEYTTRYPQTRMGVEQIMRDAFRAAIDYRRNWNEWTETREGLPPRRDLELDAIAEIVEGSRWIHCHSYRQDEILALIRTLDDFDITIGSFQHILEGYKVADAMAKHGATGSAFSDWWAYKYEVFDAIPYAGALMHNAGVVVSFNSDDRELARHLNHEAAKAVKYGGVPPEEAIKFVTLNPAKQLRIDQHVGSLEPGKHADLVVWNSSPLSTLSRCEQTWIDGRKYFDIEDDRRRRADAREKKTFLIQKILASGETMRSPDEGDDSGDSLWPREDIFCAHGDDHGHGHGHRHEKRDH